MQRKLKTTLQRAKNLVHVKQHYDNHFSKKRFYIFFIYVVGIAIECLILTILTITKCVQNLHKDSTLSVFSIAKIVSS